MEIWLAVREKIFEEFVLFMDGGHIGLATTSILTNLKRLHIWTTTVKFGHHWPSGSCGDFFFKSLIKERHFDLSAVILDDITIQFRQQMH
ncbi:MAG: hypothetical protein ABW185_29755 [Sedimenticola sp.]